MGSFYITTAIPYVNAEPHLGFALELVQADVLARYHRLCGDLTWFLTGTDENSLTNVLAAEREGLSVRALVDRNAGAFRDLTRALHISNDDFIRTATDPRHRDGVERFWQACVAAGDVYKRAYRGLYCVRCERFYATDELVDGRCPEHGIAPEVVEEENYFFRLSRYAEHLRALFDSRALRVVPESRHREIEAFIARGLTDFSISRTRTRARGWGIPGSGRRRPGRVRLVRRPDELHHRARLWRGRRALSPLLGGQPPPRPPHRQGHPPLPCRVLAGDAAVGRRAAPVAHRGPRLSDEGRAENEQDARHRRRPRAAGGVVGRRRRALLAAARGPAHGRRRLHRGGLRARVHRGPRRRSRQPAAAHGEHAASVPRGRRARGRRRGHDVAAGRRRQLPAALHRALGEDWDPRVALDAIFALVRRANQTVEETKPWALARAERDGDATARRQLDGVLGDLTECLRLVAEALRPLLPETADRMAAQLGVTAAPAWRPALEWGSARAGPRVGAPVVLFPKRAASTS